MHQFKKYRFYIFLSLLVFLFYSGCPHISNQEGISFDTFFTGGQYHLGPVDFAETEWHNAFAPYPQEIQELYGSYLAGIPNNTASLLKYCDACIQIETDEGKFVIARVITYGETADYSLDVSPEAYAVLNSGEYPRSMSWQVVKAPVNGKNIYLQFKSGAHQWWTAFWIRNSTVPVDKLEIKSENHSSWTQMSMESDGSYADYSGFGVGPYSIRLTGIDGQVIEESFSYPASGFDGLFFESSIQFE